MLKRIVLFVAGVLMTGCTALMNSGRPAYHGPVAKAAWHNFGVLVSQPPVIHGGFVYAVARSWSDRETPHVMSFDLKDGAPVRTSDLRAGKILVAAGSTLFATDESDRVHALDARTGREIGRPGWLNFAKGTPDDGALYTVSASGTLEARLLAKFQDGSQEVPPLWRSAMPMRKPAKPLLAPVIASGTVYISGFSEFDLATVAPAVSGIYALDAKSGNLRWKWEIQDKKDCTPSKDWPPTARVSTFGCWIEARAWPATEF